MAPGDTLPGAPSTQPSAQPVAPPAQPVSAEIVAAAGETPRAELAALKNAIDAQLQEFVKLVRSKSTDFPGPDPTNIKDLGKHEIFMELYGGLQSFFTKNKSNAPEELQKKWMEAASKFLAANSFL